MYKALDVAAWFVAWADADDEARLSNLKLQKLLYYAQGAHMAERGAPLFGEPIQAWAHGPVVPAVYRAYSQFGSEPIEGSGDYDWNGIDSETAKVLVRVWNTFGSKSAWKLRDMTHQESPWRDHYEDGKRHIEIPQEDIGSYFKRVLKPVAEVD